MTRDERLAAEVENAIAAVREYEASSGPGVVQTAWNRLNGALAALRILAAQNAPQEVKPAPVEPDREAIELVWDMLHGAAHSTKLERRAKEWLAAQDCDGGPQTDSERCGECKACRASDRAAFRQPGPKS